MTGIGFLRVPEVTPPAQLLFDEDLTDVGFVMNVSRLWAYQPDVLNGLFGLMRQITSAHRLSVRERGILVSAFASAFGDSYCSLAWGTKLAVAAGTDTAAGVLKGVDNGLQGREKAMARWARKVARDPNRTTADDVQELRDAGFSDSQIFALTVFVALRITLSTVNDALGVGPDAEFRLKAPRHVFDAVTYGRPVDAPAQRRS